MQRKFLLYLLVIAALAAFLLPMGVAAQTDAPPPYQLQEATGSGVKDAVNPKLAEGAIPYVSPDGMAFFNETEPNNTAATANALSGSQAVVLGNVNPAGDYDYFSFTANAGDRVFAAVQTQWSTVSGDSRLDIMASDGTTSLEFDDDDGTFASFSSSIAGTRIPATGTYYVRVYGYSATTVITPYHLHFRVQSGSPTAEVEPNNTAATATPLAASQWMSGTITGLTPELDYFSFTLNAGDSVYLSLDMDPGRLASNAAWNGRLGFGPLNGFILVTNDSSTTKPNSEALFMTVQDAGTYYAYVDSLSATNLGPTARYRLSVSIYPKQAVPNCTTFTSTDVPKTLGPGLGTTTSTIVVPNTVTASITDLNVSLNLTHTLMADLDVTLLGPTAASTPLFTDIGSVAVGGQTVMDEVFDDQAALPIGPYTVVKDMINQPEQPGRLSTFNGTSATGTWTLQLADDTNTSGGRLQSWSLEICGAPPPAYDISLNKTVGVQAAQCATTDSITLPAGGGTVYYCYTVTNNGLNPVNTHTLVDSQLGTLFTNLNYTLAPGANYSYIAQATVNSTVTNTATWTATDGTGSDSATDTATVTVPASVCQAGYRQVILDVATFDAFPPAGWTVTNTSSNCAATGVPEWTNTNPGARLNLTGGYGPFAIADSDKCGSGSTLDTIMSTDLLNFTGLISPTLNFNTDYHDFGAGGDQAQVDLSTDGGATWTNLLTWDTNHRGPLLVTQALTGAAGQNDAKVRWHYVQGTYDWWWQVDNAAITACELIPVAGVEITKTADGPSAVTLPGGMGTISYTVSYTNTSPTLSQQEMTFTDMGAISAGSISCSTPVSDTLDAGDMGMQTVTCDVDVTADLCDDTTVVLTNTVDVEAVTIPAGDSAMGSATAAPVTITVPASDPGNPQCQPSAPEITLSKTVGTTSGVCATTSKVTVAAGTTVYYCYQVENTGNVTFTYHSLVDSELGTLFSNSPYVLGPGDVAPPYFASATINITTTNVATWTATSALGGYTANTTAAYNYIPINTTGAALGLADDGEANITLPFAFTFYGVTSSNLRVGNNGGILFNATTGDVAVANIAIPAAAPAYAILPFWDDIDSDTGDVYWEVQGTAPNRMAIIEWYNRPHYSNIGSATFEVILYEGSNEIKFQYADVDFGDPAYNNGASATVGINKDATAAIQVSFNQAVISNGQAILFTPTVPVTVSDSDVAEVNVLYPQIAVDPMQVALKLFPDQTTTRPLTITNVGDAPLVWTIWEENLPRPAAQPVQGPRAANPAAAADKVSPTDGLKPEELPASPLTAWTWPAAVLYDNGPLVTHPGAGAGGADASAVQTALLLSTYGFGHAVSSGFRVADDFTVPAGGWNISTITFFAYQTNSTTTSTINAVNLRIWDGVPGAAGSNVVFGDPTTNRLASSTWANMYRVLDTALTGSTRPIMADVVTVNTLLPAGTYWLDWQTGGTLTSGPWAPPVSILGQTAKPGANGLQYDPTTMTWNDLVDTGANTVQDLPFVIQGTSAVAGNCTLPADIPWLTVSPTNGTTAAATSTGVVLTFNSTGLTPGVYTGNLCIASNDPDAGPGDGTDLVVVPVTLTVSVPTAVTLGDLSANAAQSPAPLGGMPLGVAMPAALSLSLAAAYIVRRKK